MQQPTINCILNAFYVNCHTISVVDRLPCNLKVTVSIMEAEIINKASLCDLTRFTSVEISWKLENLPIMKTTQCEFNLTESIKM